VYTERPWRCVEDVEGERKEGVEDGGSLIRMNSQPATYSSNRGKRMEVCGGGCCRVRGMIAVGVVWSSNGK